MISKCPVCNGCGNVCNGFYRSTGHFITSDGTIEKCRSCNGIGVLKK